jgi:hypothetical protein
LCALRRQVVADAAADTLDVLAQPRVVEVVAGGVLLRQALAVLGQPVEHVELTHEDGQSLWFRSITGEHRGLERQ